VRHPASLVGARAVDIDDAVTVLLIEDDEAAAEMYRLRLAADGYTVLIASDGEHGLRRAVEDRPDLIYLDVRLPKMDGFEVLERLRANVATASIPVVIVTNYGEPELQQRGLSLGALEFLVKADTTPARLSQTFERLSETESVRS
jgi:DNA-binding response OmpR family regulator